MKKFIYILFASMISTFVFGQTVQNIRGLVKDAASEQPLAFATILLLNTEKATSTDSLGHFILKNIPVGRYDVKVTF